MKDILNFISENWIWLGPIVFEVAARLLPTQKSLSIINAVKVIADKVIPNLKKDSVTGEVSKHQ
jgi:hypothetical protein